MKLITQENKSDHSHLAGQIPMQQGVVEHVRDYEARGFCPIPVPYKEKAPRLRGWNKLNLQGDDLVSAFGTEPINIGINLGDASNGLVDVDLDCVEAVVLAHRFLPVTDMIFGRSSKPSSHWLYKAEDPGGRHPFSDPEDGEMLLEYRVNGHQTVFPRIRP